MDGFDKNGIGGLSFVLVFNLELENADRYNLFTLNIQTYDLFSWTFFPGLRTKTQKLKMSTKGPHKKQHLSKLSEQWETSVHLKISFSSLVYLPLITFAQHHILTHKKPWFVLALIFRS